jgi:outer membrane protein TolC
MILSSAVVLSVLAAPPAAASTPVEALVQEALAASPDLRALEAAAAAARQRPAQAAALPDPVAAVTLTNEGWSPSIGEMPDSSLGVMVAQDLPWPGKRGLRRRIAELDAVQAEQQLARGRLALAAGVRRAFAGLHEARGLLELTREQAGVWRQIEGVARARYGVGQGTQQDVLRAQVELTRVEQGVVEQEASAAIRQAELNRLLGREASVAIETSATTDAPAETLDRELESARVRSPELAAARSAADRARLALDLARRDYRPDLGVQAAYMNRGGLDPMWQAGLTVTLPLRRKRRAGAEAEAELLVRAAEQRLLAADLQLRFRTQERLAQLEAARRTTVLYQEGIVPQGRMSVEAAVASYQAGRLPFLSVLEALVTLYGDRASLLRLQAGQARIRAALHEASLEPAEGMGPLPAGPGGVGTAAAPGATAGGMGAMR